MALFFNNGLNIGSLLKPALIKKSHVMHNMAQKAKVPAWDTSLRGVRGSIISKKS